MRHITHFERPNRATKRRAVSDKGLNLIKQFEGFSPTIYICPAGYPTIGYDHVVKDDEAFPAGIDEERAIELLRQDAVVAECAVLRLIKVPLTSNQFDALVSFTYNLGSGALQSSTLRRKINRGEHNEAPEQFLRWVFAGGRKLKGLVIRRQAEGDLYSI
ncbi:lysozyme [Bartonella rattaustraliani]|uniref:lysozyme n=1 Tax=Bartonella rattaustraliani TaxID=481139 RepID=UPI00036D9F06|nr:lysozyme [Bartonella rattaustraliani]